MSRFGHYDMTQVNIMGMCHIFSKLFHTRIPKLSLEGFLKVDFNAQKV